MHLGAVLRLAAALLLLLVSAGGAAETGVKTPPNVLLFVAAGLRPGMVNEHTAPVMSALLNQGVRFTNSHAVFPTLMMANAAAMATAHMPGDTGVFGNVQSAGFPSSGAAGSLTPSLTSGPVLRDIAAHFGGNGLNEETILRAAADAGFSTAAIGRLAPGLLFGGADDAGKKAIIVGEAVDGEGGAPEKPRAPDILTALKQAGMPAQPPVRSQNVRAGDFKNPGTLVADLEQQGWFTDLAVKVVLPLFKARRKPFLMVFWSADPAATQQNQGDSLLRLMPGINGPTSLAAISNADAALGRLLAALKALGLDTATDVVVVSDAGFSTISKESATSFAAARSYPDVPPALLPPGFLAIDLAHGLGIKLFDPDAAGSAVPSGRHPSRANGLLGDDPAHPTVVVAANGGSDLIYLPSAAAAADAPPDAALAARIVGILAAQDYVSGLFVDPRFGVIAGALPLPAVALAGTALLPLPAIVVNFRSFSIGCTDPTTCAVTVADTTLQQGQGSSGSFSRAETRNVMGAVGPGFRQAYADPVPVSTADIGRTIGSLLGLTTLSKGTLIGRVLTEAMPSGAMVGSRPLVMHSAPDEAGRVTVAKYQVVGGTRYFDAAGYPGRTLGLE